MFLVDQDPCDVNAQPSHFFGEISQCAWVILLVRKKDRALFCLLLYGEQAVMQTRSISDRELLTALKQSLAGITRYNETAHTTATAQTNFSSLDG